MHLISFVLSFVTQVNWQYGRAAPFLEENPVCFQLLYCDLKMIAATTLASKQCCASRDCNTLSDLLLTNVVELVNKLSD